MVKFTRLADGTWGIRAWGTSLKAGQTVSVTKRDGKTVKMTVAEVIERDGKATVASVVGHGKGQVSKATRLGRSRDDAEYARGANDVRAAQMMGPAGSPGREAAYLAMEQQWAREGFDG